MTDLDAFLRSFVLPLVAGGDVHVAGPIAAATLGRWEVDLSSAAEALVAIDDARAAALATLVVRPPPLAFGAADLRLCAALYDALVLAHPRSVGWLNRRGRRELAARSRALAEVGPAAGRAELLGRHALVGRVFELTRRDTLVRWWTGKAEFRGVDPPPRLLRWRRVRRVHAEATDVPVGDVLGGDDGRQAVAALVRASPLTDLLSLALPARRHPPFRWGPQVEILRDAELARAVAYAWLGDLYDDDPPAEAAARALQRLRAPAAAAGAWEHALATPLELLPRTRGRGPGAGAGERRDRERAAGPGRVAPALPVIGGAEAAARLASLLLPGRPAPALSSADLRAATAFLVHLNALAALAEIHLSDPDAPSPVVAAGLSGRRTVDLGGAETGGARVFFCVPDAAGRCDPALAAPPGLGGNPRLARRWAAHRVQVRQAVGEDRLAQLARRLQVCL